jgi:long-chain acyl-CoA synthetase
MSRLDDLLQKLRGFAPLPLLDGDTTPCTYGDLLQAIEAWQRQLDAREIGPGSVVAVRADYSLDAIALLFALLLNRSVLVLVPANGATGQYLRDSCAQWLCTLGAGEKTLQAVQQSSTHPLLQALAARNEGGVVIFTSGSSGSPKAALHGSEGLLAKYSRPGRRMRTLAFLLFDHVAGIDTLLYTVSNGGTLVLTRQRDPGSILELIERCRVEVLPVSPSFLRLLCLDEGHEGRDLSSLRIITYGSEPMDSVTLARLNERFPTVRLLQKYGTTETGSPRSESRDNNSLWLKLADAGVESKIIDGVLWLRGAGTTLGYLNAPSPTDESGWYCTGDRVETDGEWIRFVGRASEVINVGGEKVFPVEVEQVILELDAVLEVVVRGEPHVLMGQIVTAQVSLVPGADPKATLRQIRSHCSKRLQRFKVPVKIDIATHSLVGERRKVRRI